MSDINVVVLNGRITKDCEMRSTKNGTSVVRYSIAVNKKRKVNGETKEDVSYFDIVVWGKPAETLKPYLIKGKMVAVEGELRQRRWEIDGQKRSSVEIVAKHIQFLSPLTSGKPEDKNNPDVPVDVDIDVEPGEFEDSDIPF